MIDYRRLVLRLTALFIPQVAPCYALRAFIFLISKRFCTYMAVCFPAYAFVLSHDLTDDNIFVFDHAIIILYDMVLHFIYGIELFVFFHRVCKYHNSFQFDISRLPDLHIFQPVHPMYLIPSPIFQFPILSRWVLV